MSLSDFIVHRPRTVFFAFVLLTLLIGSQAIVLVTNITMDVRDYLPAEAESIQVLNQISSEMAGVDLLAGIDPFTISEAGVAIPITVYIKSDSDLTELDCVMKLNSVERLIAREFESRGVVSVQSYASFITQIAEFYGGTEGKIPPVIDLMNFLEAHEISLADIIKLTSSLSMPTSDAGGNAFRALSFIFGLPDPVLNGLEWSLNSCSAICFRLTPIESTAAGSSLKEIIDFLNAHDVSFVDIKGLLQIMEKGSADPQKDLDFMFSIMPESVLNLLLPAGHTETTMVISVEPEAIRLEGGREGGILMESKELTELERDIEDFLKKNAPDGMEFTVAGPASMREELTSYMFKWLGILIPASLAAIGISIFLFHRNWKSVFIVLIPTFAGLALTLGLLGLLPMNFSFEDVIVTPTLISFGFAYSLHLVNRFSEEAETYGPEEGVRRTISTTGIAVFLSAITTVAGFASLMFTPLPVIGKMGFVLLLGIVCLYLSAIILVPCLLLILKYRKKGKIRAWKRVLGVVSHTRVIISAVLLITLFSVLLIPMVSTEVDIFVIKPPAGLPLTQRAMDYTEKLGMGQPGVLMIRGDVTNPWLTADVEALVAKLNQLESVTRAYSVLDFIKPFNLGQTPTGDEVKFILDTAGETISGMMGVFGEVGLNEILLNKTLIMVDMPQMDIESTGVAVQQINDIIDSSTLTGGSATHVTGMGAILWDLHSLLLPSQIQSLILAIIGVFVCLVVIFRSLKYGTFTLIPLLIGVLWEPLVLVALNVPLSVITVAVASIILGTGIDFGVHITERTREEIRGGKGGAEAAQIAVMTSGQTLFEAIVAVCLGLLPMYLLNMEIINQFLTVIILMLVIAWFAALIVLPTIYMGYFKRFEKAGK